MRRNDVIQSEAGSYCMGQGTRFEHAGKRCDSRPAFHGEQFVDEEELQCQAFEQNVAEGQGIVAAPIGAVTDQLAMRRQNPA